MADATTAVTISGGVDAQEARDACHILIKTSEVLVPQGLVSIAVTTGLAENADDAVDLIPAGIVVGPSSSGGSLTGDATRKASIESGQVLKNVAVTGVTAITNRYALVYATDNQTLTLTKPTAALPVGWVRDLGKSGSGYADVALFTLTESLMWSHMSLYETIYLGHIDAPTGTAAISGLLSWTATFRGQITAYYAYASGFNDGFIAGAQTVSLTIAGTTVKTTGDTDPVLLTLGYAQIDTTGDMGTKISSSAISSADIFSQGEAVAANLVVSGTGFTADLPGGYNVYLTVKRLPGA